MLIGRAIQARRTVFDLAAGDTQPAPAETVRGLFLAACPNRADRPRKSCQAKSERRTKKSLPAGRGVPAGTPGETRHASGLDAATVDVPAGTYRRSPSRRADRQPPTAKKHLSNLWTAEESVASQIRTIHGSWPGDVQKPGLLDHGFGGIPPPIAPFNIDTLGPTCAQLTQLVLLLTHWIRPKRNTSPAGRARWDMRDMER